MGFSLGGLTSCYAAYKFPAVFSRALCLSPSIWWNKGDLGQEIQRNSPLKAAPKSVIMYLGSAEIYADFTDILLNPWKPWLDYIEQTAEAFALTKGVYVGGAISDGGFHMIASWYALQLCTSLMLTGSVFFRSFWSKCTSPMHRPLADRSCPDLACKSPPSHLIVCSKAVRGLEKHIHARFAHHRSIGWSWRSIFVNFGDTTLAQVSQRISAQHFSNSSFASVIFGCS